MKMKIGWTPLIPRFEHLLVLVFLIAINGTPLNAQAISATDGTTNCSVCAPTGWTIANGTPDISDRNFAASAGTSNGGTSWTAAPLPLPPNNHTNWISLRDLGPTGVEEIIETTITGLTIGETYQLTIYTLTATALYSPEFNDSFRYQIGSGGLQTVNGIAQNTWGTETIVFVASATAETIQFLPGNNSGGAGAFESVQISVTENAIVAVPDSDNDGVPDTSDVCDGFNDNNDNDGDDIPDGCDDDDDNDGIPDLVELQPFFGSLNYEYYDGVPSGQTVANIPTSGALSEGLETDFEAAQLSTAVAGNTTTFGIRYTGRIYLSTSTDYTFYLSSDDGSTLSIDGNEIVNNDGNHACVTVNQTTSLNEGFHEIEILYYQDQGGTCLGLEYETSAITRQNVPFSILLPTTASTDTDSDGSQDSFDNDSDEDGCFDTLEGDGGFTYSDIDTSGRLTATINGSGVPGGTTQNDVSSKDNTQKSNACTDDQDGDGIDNEQEFENGTDFSNPCDPSQTSSYQGFDTNNAIWQAADCDSDGQSNADEINDGDATTNPYCNGILDTGGGSYLEDQGVTNGNNSDGEADGTFTNNISGSDTLTLTFPSLEAGSEICITVGFNNDNGVVNFDLNGSTSNFSNPNGNTTYAAQVICIIVATTGTQTLIISETGSGNIQVDGSTYYQCNFVDGDDDGDGVLNSIDTAPNDTCIPVQASGYTGFDDSNATWQAADCDNDGVLNGDEFENGTDPYAVSDDTDGDGVDDDNEIENATDLNNPCDPIQSAGYTGFDSTNAIWQAADCDNDGVLNGDEFENGTDPYAISSDSDGDGIDDDNENENGTDENNSCDPSQVAGYSGFDSTNVIWRAADCDNDGVLNGDEFDNGTDPYAQSVDTDGDGVDDDNEIENGTDENDPCDPVQTSGYTGFDENNVVWQGGDCDNDGVLNGDEFENGTNPYSASADTDGDGINDDNEIENGSDENDPCDPAQPEGYTGFDSANAIWQAADCDSDGVLNGAEFSNGTDPYAVSEDTDGDGINDDNEIENGSDENDPCSPFQNPGYSDFDSNNAIWSAADCDDDGVTNGDEFTNGTDPYEQSVDTDGDGIDDDNEIANNTDRIDPCDPQQLPGYGQFVGSNSIWRAADCDNDGILNGSEFDNGTDPYSSSGDTDGDGIDDETEIANGTDEINPCDPVQNSSYTGFDGNNTIWRGADCDGDGVSNGDEFDNGTNPYATSNDTDGDGINDDNEIDNGSSPTDACDPAQQPGYTGFDLNNPIWQADDCDNDGISNGDEISNGTDPYTNPGDTDGDGILDDSELAAGSDVNDPCSPSQPINYEGFNPNNPIWRAADCDGDGVLNGNEFDNGTNPYAFSSDTDGDGVNDDNEIDDGTDINDPCSPSQNAGYSNFNDQNSIWSNADCDGDGVSNGDEFNNGTDPYQGGTDTDGDGISDDVELANGSLPNDPCNPTQLTDYTGFDGTNAIWRDADCDNDGALNGTEFDNGTNPYDNSGDNDGDGVSNDFEVASGFDPTDPCDPEQKVNYDGFNPNNSIWAGADCDGDGFLNGEEVDRGTNPYLFTQDSDGDGLFDETEVLQGSDGNNPCDPIQEAGYNGFNEENAVWLAADCDDDGVSNGEEFNNGTDPYTFDETLDPDGDADGDGISNGQELEDGTDPNNSCDSIGGTPSAEDDCDNDGLTNGEESTGVDDPTTPANPNGNTTDPSNEDSDGDGITDGQEALDQTNPNDACDSEGGTPPANIDCSLVSIASDLVSPQTNGRFTIQNIERFPNNIVTIYNRWGVKVYEATNYDNANIVFDGISTAGATLQKSEELPAGVYFYIINYDRNGESLTLNGYLYLNR